ncbi:MAG: filamentous hemagglutinin N-terminal domain-containing protein [Verrucomicrobiales bacterium]|nr:filamentous hemagglutinin N-terminal domain-containing protein [Verrucomicrobiales bacterium]
MFSTGPVAANPSGGVVVHGDISIANGGNGLLNVNQNSAMAIINWSDFSIAAGETTRFNQPGAQAAVLNRVTGGDPSAIFGALQGNGSVFVINPNGILVGSTGIIDVHGLVLSTLDLSNGEFLAGGDMTFLGSGDAGVVNLGKINAIGGDVFLFGNTVTNEGSITARDGTVGIGAGREVLLAAKSNTMGERVFVRAGGSGNTGILNTGSIEGAAVELKAHGNMYALAINNKGSIRAVGAVNQGGRAFLRGVGGSVSNSGSIEVTSSSSSYSAGKSASAVIQAAYARVDGAIRAEGGSVRITGSESVEVGGLINVSSGAGKGGDITVEGQNVAIGGTAVVDASGSTGGGSVRIGGGFQGRDTDLGNARSVNVESGSLILADATGDGDAGTVIVWSDRDTEFRGEISAEASGAGNGGFVEVSGKQNLLFDGNVSTRAESGFNGTLLLDPTNFTITAGAGASTTNSIGSTTLVGQLANNNVIIATDSLDTPGQDGDITVNAGANVVWTNSNSLTLLAHDDIFINANIQNSSNGGIYLVAGWDGAANQPGSAGANSYAAPVVTDETFAVGEYGSNEGSVYIGSESAVQGIAVGSRDGRTGILGYDLNVVAPVVGVAASVAADRYAQVGYRDVSTGLASTGSINIQLTNQLTMTAGNGQVRNYAQIGHGGADGTTTTAAGNLSGDIRVSAANGIVMNAGSASTQNYVQIGHGGYQAGIAGSSHGGNISVFSANGGITGLAGAGTDNYAQIGNGGRLARGAHSGDVAILAKGDIQFTGSANSGGYVQVGNGGNDADSGGGTTDKTGSIRVASAAGSILFSSGTGTNAYAHLGNGGLSTDGNHTGSITARAAQDIIFDGNTGVGTNAYVQLGNGGLSAIGNYGGAIIVSAGTDGAFSDVFDVDRDGIFNEAGEDDVSFVKGGPGTISFSAGSGTDKYAQLGHGGRTARGDHSGSIDVSAFGNISFSGGTTTQTYAMLGHGGRDADNPNPNYYPDNDPNTVDRGPTAAERIGNSGNINVTSTVGGVLFTAGSGTESFVLLGHGGSYTDGDQVGHITVNAAGGIVFDASNAAGTIHYAQLGHGGYLASGGHTGDISATAGGDVVFTGGTSSSYVQIGHGGRNDHRVNRGGTTGAYVQNNANDRYFPGTHTGGITVSGGNNITFTGGNQASAYAQVGHGGYRNDAEAGEGHNGDISVVGGGLVSFSAGALGQTHAQVGHGGYETYGNHGYQVVRTEVGSITATQAGTANLVNGTLAPGSVRITVDPQGAGAGTAVFTDDGNGNLIDGASTVVGTVNYLSGEVTFVSDVNSSGDPVDVAYLYGGSDILVEGADGVLFSGGQSSQAYAQIGHGGYDADLATNRNIRPEEVSPAVNASTTSYHLNTPSGVPLGSSGNITVRAGFDGTKVTNANAQITFTGGSGADAYVQIGNGGRATDGDHVGNITVDATGDILLAGGSHQRTYAQIGNGGYDSDSNILTPTKGNTGDILINNNLIGALVNAVGSVSFLGGSGEESYVQLGHGGHLNMGANFGMIDLRSAGDITFTSGDGSGIGDLDGSGTAFVATVGHGRRSYAQLGHGGYDADAASSGGVDGIGHRGNINVTSGGNVSFTSAVVTDPAAEDYRNYVLLGHGGLASSGDHSGDITVVAEGNLTFTSGGILASDPVNAPVSFFSQDSFAQLGHGGRDSDGYGTADTTGHSGDIRVEAGGGITFTAFNAGTSGEAVAVNDGYVQLGHGGLNVDGSQKGKVDVAALGGAITFDASKAGVDGFAQLGHGGRLGKGDHVGDIYTDAFGAISFLGGSTLRTYAQLGHGGHDADYLTGVSAKVGNSGDIFVNTRSALVTNTGGVFFTAGTGEESYVQLGHGGHATQGAHSGNLLGLNSIDVRAGGDIIFVSGDGSGFGDDTAASEGNGRRSWAQLGHGGYDSDAASSGGVDGDGHDANINVQAAGAITFTASDLIDPVAGPDMQAQDFRNYVQLGHGGLAANGDHRGSITVTAGNGIAFTAGGVDPAATANLSQDAYAQIGHGGYAADGYGGADLLSKVGNISVTATGGDIVFKGSNATEAYVQIGHGGRDVDGGTSGSITVSALSGAITFEAGTGADNYAQVGNGGRTARGNHGLIDAMGQALETIRVTAAGDITFSGGSGARSYAQLGNGGYDADSTVAPLGSAANINVTSRGGSILFQTEQAGSGDAAYVQLGNGGYATSGDHRGTIEVTADRDITVAAAAVGTVANAYAQLGHGGRSAIGNHSGDITVNAGVGGVSGGLTVRSGGGAADRYAQLGHGGRLAGGSHSGEIEVTTLDTILFQTGTSTRNYVQLGHGGHEAAAVGVGAGDPGNSGGINVQSTAGAVEFRLAATNTSPGTDAYAQLGHGGNLTGGDHTGSIDVTAETNLLFRSSSSTGTGSDTYVQLGHGGIDASGNFNGDITATANTGYAQFRSGASTSTTTTAGNNRYALLGHGGTNSLGNFSGDIRLLADDAITFTNQSTSATIGSYTQLGHGGLNATSTVGHTGDIAVTSRTSSITFTGAAGSSTDSYTQLGHGGTNATGSHSGDIAVQSATTTTFTGGTAGIRNYAQLGHGGYNADALAGEGHSGRIGVAAGTNLTFTAGSGASEESYAQLGHGGFGATGNQDGDIVARAGNTLIFNASTGTDTIIPDAIDPINNPPTRIENRGYAQLGHGGYAASGNHSGDITASSQLSGDFVDIGDFDGDGFNEVISMVGGATTTNPFSFLAGTNATADAASDAYAQLGHGGRLATGTRTGDILVDVERTVRFQAGALGARTYAQLGHGGHDAASVIDLLNPIGLANSGDIDVRARTGAVNFLWVATNTATSSETYIQLGHGGFVSDPLISGVDAGGDNSGEIAVEAGTNILFRSTDDATVDSNSNYAQLGHGGLRWVGNHSGDIAARAGTAGVSGTVTFSAPNLTTAAAGISQNRYVQLGHGGFQARGDHSGDISVLSLGSISFRGGRVEGGYAQLGHGGLDADDESTALGNTGDIRVASQTGNINFQWNASTDTPGEFSYVQLGHGGYRNAGDHSGDTTVRAGGLIQFRGGTGNTAPATGFVGNYAQLGHGGFEAAGNHSGDLTVSAGTDGGFTDVFDLNMNGVYGEASLDEVTFTSTGAGSITFLSGGSQADRYAQLGHGGTTARGDHDGNISVTALGNIVFTAGTGTRGYAMIGHGGHDADSHNPDYYGDNDPLNPLRGPTAAERIGNTGNIHVETLDGDILFTTGNATGSTFTPVQIGHGGTYTDGDHIGDITVIADADKSNAGSGGDITFRANTSGTTHSAQIGHGGFEASGGHTGAIVVTAGEAITFTGGSTNNNVQIGHGGMNDHRVTRGGSSPNYTQSNNNDLYYPGTHSGSVMVGAGSNITFTGGSGTAAYAQIGHGGYRNAAEAGEGHNGAISVVGGGSVNFTALNGAQGYVQVGHGGYEAFGNHGYEVVRSEAGSIAATQMGSANLGNGALAPGSVKIIIDPQGTGAGTATFTDDGKGNLIDGALTVVGTVNYLTGEVSFTSNINTAGDAVEVAYLHGGSDILVDGGTGVTFAAGTGTNTNAQIGHGGPVSSFSSTLNIDPEEVAPAVNTSSTTYHLNTPSANPLGTSGNITVLSGTGNTTDPNAALMFTSGAGNDAYAQIGNGGRNARGDHRGEIDVRAAGDISFAAFNSGAATQTSTNSSTLNNLLQNDAATSYTMGQTGNLERGSIVITYSNPLAGFTGTIRSDDAGRLFDGETQVGTVTTAGVVDLTVTVSDSSAGAAASVITFDHLNLGLRAYVQIGHGGDDADNPNATTPGDPGNLGNISVISNDGAISFAAGSRNESYAQIGHGGYATNGDHSGNVVVEALGTNGAITFTAGNRAETYAQLGHGGRSAKGNFGLVDVDNDMLADGDITARAAGAITFTAGSAGQTYAQIGHGGYDADTVTTPGNPSNRGNILVESNTGDIAFSAAGSVGSNSYVQLGHGGMSTSGDFSGSITTRAHGGAVIFTGGEANDGYAQLGHGGRAARGDHNGGIEVLGANGVFFTGGGVATVTSEKRTVLNDAAAAGGGATGTLANTGNLDRSSFVITVFDPVSPEYATITSDAAGILYDGNGAPVGSVATNGTVTFDVAVAKAGADGISVAYNHINYSRGYVQLGNGGHDADPTGAAGGTPNQQGNIKVVSTAGNIEFTAGLGDANYAQLGNGGFTTSGDHSGEIMVEAAGDVKFTAGTFANTATGMLNSRATNYAQLGHGGNAAAGNHSGTISVSSTGGGITALAGNGTDTYVQIGHGGRTARGDHSGKIDVTALNDITFNGGSAGQTYAMIGHGGRDADNPNSTYYPDNDPATLERGPTAAERVGNDGNIAVTSSAGKVAFTTGSGTESFVQIGHGGSLTDGDHVGSITVSAVDILFDASSSVGSTHYAQLGHGGYFASGGHEGIITVNATGAITFAAGTTGSYTQIGHGGYNDHRLTRGGSSPNFTQANNNDRYFSGTHSGAINVSAGAEISFTGGVGTGSYGQIGHGGYRNAAEAGEGHNGDISVVGGGAVSFTAQNGSQAYVQVGHGGYEAFGNHGYEVVRTEAGSIAATQAGSATLENGALAPGSVKIIVDPQGAGAGTVTFADDGKGNLIDATLTVVGTVNYLTGEVAFSTNVNGAGDAVEVAYLYGGSDILVDGGAGVLFTAGTGSNTNAQIGHGGASSSFSSTLNIDPEESAPAANTSTTTYHLNTPSVDPLGMSGNVTVLSGTGSTTNPGTAVTFTSGAGNDAYAQIGNGGRNARGDHRGEIDVQASGDISFVSFNGGAASQTVTNNGTLNNLLQNNGASNYTMAQTGNLERGTIVITYANPLAGFTGEIRSDSFGRLFDGDVQVGTVSTGGVIDLTETVSDSVAGAPASVITFDHLNLGLRSYVQIGHGGHDADFPTALTPGDGGNLGNVSVTSNDGAIHFAAGSRSESYAQIGHGGYTTNGDHSGNIAVEALGTNGSITFAAGNRVETYAQLGHGGRSARGNFGLVDVDNDMILDGDITARSTGSVAFTAGSAGQTYAQLGHGGYDSDALTTAPNASNRGNILVESNAGDITFNAAGSVGANAYVQLGHGGHSTNGDFSGSITAHALGGSVVFTAGEVNERYAQIGHGGRSAKGDHSGDIDVMGASGVSFTSGGIAAVSGESSGALIDAAAGGGATATLAITSNIDRSSIVITVTDPVLPEYAALTSNAAGQLFDAMNNQVGTISAGGVVTFTTAVSSSRANAVSVAYNHSGYSRGYVQLGHGGYDSDPTGAATAKLSKSGEITVASTSGDIAFTAGQGGNNYAQLGHGGMQTTGARSGGIEVISGGNVILNRGTADDAYVQIGHGTRSATGNSTGDISVSGSNGGSVLIQGSGLPATNGTAARTYGMIGHGGHDADGAHNGAIDITAEGEVLVQGGGTDASFAMIGHGGNITDGTLGDANDIISVRAGTGVRVLGGAGNDSFAMIGLGGLTSTGTREADILVETTNGNIVLIGGASTTVDDAFAQIGNGGAQTTSTTQGSVKVRASNGDVILTAGAGQVGTTTQTANYVQIGHGGHENIGNHGVASDTIAVLANNIVLNGGTTVDEAYAQIGNGGFGSNGNHAGSIQIDATGNLTVRGGTRVEAYALVGHGGVRDTFVPANANYTTGTRTGNILANIGGTTSLVDQTTIGFMGHLGTTGVAAGSRLALITGQLDTSATLRKTTGLIQNMIGGGDVEIGVTNGNLLIDGTGVFASNANGIDLFATGDVTFMSSVQNAGTGSVAVVGGWDGSTGLMRTIDRDAVAPLPVLSLNADSVFADANGFGNAGGVIVGNAAQVRAVVVGSANGTTRVAGNSVEVNGGAAMVGSAAQIGFNEEVYRLGGGANGLASTGAIMVFTKEGGLALQGGSVTNAAAQIGHGGSNGISASFSGDIVIDLGKGNATAGLTVRGGSGSDSYALIGNGGRWASGSKSGNITIAANSVELAGGTDNFTSASIGHGGGEGSGAIGGSINLVALGDVSLFGNSGDFASAAIGHGGAFYAGAVNSTLTSLQVGGDLEVRGGPGVMAGAQIGHGGSRFSGNIAGTALTVDVTIDILVSGGLGNFSYAQIGFGGYGGAGNLSGDIDVVAGNEIVLMATKGSGASFAKIGHGDDLDLAIASLGSTGNWSGDITVGAGGDLTMIDAMIGHANALSLGTSTGGVTQIGVSRNVPADPLGGTLTADAQSEFAGEDELRFYLPSRDNNEVANGAILNGVIYPGAQVDPSPTQGDDEFTINILGDEILFPNEHTNELGSGPTPVNAAGYAFYYDTIVLEALPEVIVIPGESAGGEEGAGSSGSGGGEETLSFLYGIDDEENDDVQRKRKRSFRVVNPYKLFYEGYSQYGPNGESIFDYSFQKEIGVLNAHTESPLIQP